MTIFAATKAAPLRAKAVSDGVEDVVAERLAKAVRQHVIDRDPDAPPFTP